MNIDTDKALAVLRERVIDAIAEHAAYHRNFGSGQPTHSIDGCSHIPVALAALLALNAAVAMANATYHVHPDGCDHDDIDGSMHNTKWCKKYLAAKAEAGRLAREVLEEVTA